MLSAFTHTISLVSQLSQFLVFCKRMLWRRMPLEINQPKLCWGCNLLIRLCGDIKYRQTETSPLLQLITPSHYTAQDTLQLSSPGHFPISIIIMSLCSNGSSSNYGIVVRCITTLGVTWCLPGHLSSLGPHCDQVECFHRVSPSPWVCMDLCQWITVSVLIIWSPGDL